MLEEMTKPVILFYCLLLLPIQFFVEFKCIENVPDGFCNIDSTDCKDKEESPFLHLDIFKNINKNGKKMDNSPREDIDDDQYSREMDILHNENIDKPVQLVKPDMEHKKLVILEHGFQLLRLIEGTVATVAVVGKYHSGKSFLINQLMGKSKGFGIGSSLRPETIGIWMWGKPMNFTLSSGNNISVIFLDTEGFAANNVSENYDAKIFAVATLLSSYLIYNSVKIIDQADIDYLELLARRTQLFALRSQMSKSTWTEFNHDLLTFPPLLWVIQDFVQSTTGISPKQWLHQMMASHLRENEDYELSLLGIFKSVDCHTLFLPTGQKTFLMDLSLTSEEDLTSEYRQERDALIEKLRSDLVPKEKNDEPITGLGLASLLQILVSAANDGSLAEVVKMIPNRWHIFVQRMKENAIEDCFKFYISEMRSLNAKFEEQPIIPENLTATHADSWRQSVKLLHHLLFGLGEVIEEATNSLSEQINSEFVRIKDLNEKKINLRCAEVLNIIRQTVENKLDKIVLPVTTAEVEEMKQSISEEMVAKLSATIRPLITIDTLQHHIITLKNTIQSVCNSIILKNTHLIEGLLENTIKESIGFPYSVLTKDAPLTPDALNKLLIERVHEANEHFDKVTEFAKDENIYPAYQALFKTRIAESVEDVVKRNKELVKTEGKKLTENLLRKFEDSTSLTKLPLSVQLSELDNYLNRELENVESHYLKLMSPYSQYDVVHTTLGELQDELMNICNRRRRENLDVFTQEVSVPLAAAKRVFMLSTHDFITKFSLRLYLRKVCLIHLNSSKGKAWDSKFKDAIIDHFINSDQELNEILHSRSSPFSNVVGFFQWLAWMLNLY